MHPNFSGACVELGGEADRNDDRNNEEKARPHGDMTPALFGPLPLATHRLPPAAYHGRPETGNPDRRGGAIGARCSAVDFSGFAGRSPAALWPMPLDFRLERRTTASDVVRYRTGALRQAPERSSGPRNERL